MIASRTATAAVVHRLFAAADGNRSQPGAPYPAVVRGSARTT